MVISIHQPNFLPWLGFFNKIYLSDIFVIFDDVQFPRGKNFGNRVLVRDSDSSFWLTVPVTGKSEMVNFKGILIDNSNAWFKRVSKTIKYSYLKTPFFENLFDDLEKIFAKQFKYLIDLNMQLLYYILTYLKIERKIVFSSGIKDSEKLKGQDKIVNILKELNSSCYISGSGKGSVRYSDSIDFQNLGINLIVQKFDHPVYKQQGQTFIKNLSVIDLLFNEGPNSVNFLK